MLQVELAVPGAASLKDKRRVVRSLKDRLHREHQVSVAEVGAHDRATVALLGVALASGDGRRAGEVLDAVERKLRSLFDAEVTGVDRQILDGGVLEPSPARGRDAGLDAEMMVRALGDEAGDEMGDEMSGGG
ncbi:MAG: DUF503 domain-containing protein [Planctomycetota bacterium]